jgi:predicted metal-binding protein
LFTSTQTREKKKMQETAKRIEHEKNAVLRELCDIAREGGAEDALVIPADDVIIDPRVRLRCMIAPCYYSGVCSNCPPHGYSIEEVRSKVSKYEKAVFFKVAADQRYISAPDVAHCLETDVFDDEGAVVRVGAYYILVYQIVALIEKRARELDYEPLGFAAGDCKAVFCLYHPACRAIIDRSKCRHPDLSRPAMEAAGMDAFAMAANVGWEIYPLGSSSRPGDAPRASLLGLVLVF